jgi:hypothetical protein
MMPTRPVKTVVRSGRPFGRFRTSPDVVATREGEHMALLHCRSAQHLPLDDRSRMVWELVVEGCSLAAMVARVAEQRALPAERAEADVRAVIDRLLADNFIIGTQ